MWIPFQNNVLHSENTCAWFTCQIQIGWRSSNAWGQLQLFQNSFLPLSGCRNKISNVKTLGTPKDIETKGTVLCHWGGCVANEHHQVFYAIATIEIDIICFDTCDLIFKCSYNTSIWEFSLQTGRMFKTNACI